MMFVKLWLDITLLSKIAAEDNGLLSATPMLKSPSRITIAL